MEKRFFAQLFNLPGVISVIVLFAVAVQSRGMAGDPGVGWHLETGLEILRIGRAPTVDPFGSQKPWIHTQWLSDAAMAVVYNLVGWPGLELAALLVGFIACFLLLPLALRPLGAFPEAIGAVAAILLFSVQWIVRPVVLSFFLFGVVFLLLNPRQANARYRVLLIPIFALWANLHPAFLFGLILPLIFAFSELVNRKLKNSLIGLALTGASLLATGLNPYGFLLHRQSVALSGSRFFQNLNTEWLSPDFSLSGFYPIFCAVAFTVGILILSKKGNLFERITGALLVVCALQGRRYAPFMAIPVGYLAAIVAADLLPENTFKLLRRKSNSVFLSVAAAIGLSLFVGYYGHLPLRTAESSSPVVNLSAEIREQIQHCKESGGGRVLASPDLGGLLIHSGLSPIFDDRNELHGEDHYRRYFGLVGAKDGWRKIFEEFSPDCVIRETNAPLNYFLGEYGF